MGSHLVYIYLTIFLAERMCSIYIFYIQWLRDPAPGMVRNQEIMGRLPPWNCLGKLPYGLFLHLCGFQEAGSPTLDTI